MLSRTQVIIPPRVALLSTDLMRNHARVTNLNDDDLLGMYLFSATHMVEQYLNRALITQTVRWTLARTSPPNIMPMTSVPFMVLPLGMEYMNQFQNNTVVELPRSPVQSVNSVAIGSWGKDDKVLTPDTDYILDLEAEPARVKMTSNINWNSQDHVVIEYVAGYGNSSDAVPVSIKHAVLMIATNMYENRGDDEAPGLYSDTVMALLNPYRLFEFGG